MTGVADGTPTELLPGRLHPQGRRQPGWAARRDPEAIGAFDGPRGLLTSVINGDVLISDLTAKPGTGTVHVRCVQ